MEATDASRAFGYGSEIAMMAHAICPGGGPLTVVGPAPRSASEVHLAIVKENARPV